MMFSDSIPRSSVQAIGLHRLIDELGLDVVVPAVRSEAVRGARKTRIANGAILEQYPLSYAPKDLFGHLRFAMRYEPIDLNVLAALFAKIERRELEAWVKSEPVGRYPRRAWYLYELLAGATLDVPEVPPTDNVTFAGPRAPHHGHRRPRPAATDRRQSLGQSRLLPHDSPHRPAERRHAAEFG